MSKKIKIDVVVSGIVLSEAIVEVTRNSETEDSKRVEGCG